MAFTPTNIYLANLGSLNGTLAFVDGSITSGTNNWASGIKDILAIQAHYRDVSATGSSHALMVSFTATSGTIWVQNPIGASATPFALFIYSGLAVKT